MHDCKSTRTLWGGKERDVCLHLQRRPLHGFQERKKLAQLLSVCLRVIFLQKHADLPANTQNPASISKGSGGICPRLSAKRLLENVWRVPVHS